MKGKLKKPVSAVHRKKHQERDTLRFNNNKNIG
jgi:hypothetical protein